MGVRSSLLTFQRRMAQGQMLYRMSTLFLVRMRCDSGDAVLNPSARAIPGMEHLTPRSRLVRRPHGGIESDTA